MDNCLSSLRIPIDDLKWVTNAVSSRWEKLRGRRLLLTGGTGFIGKWLLGTFLHANKIMNLSANVVVVSRNPEKFIEQFPDLRKSSEITWVASDVREVRPESLGEFDFAIHAATDVADISSPVDILDTCVSGTQKVLGIMRQGSQSRRMLLLSSGAVYCGAPPGFIRIPEDWRGAPDSLMPSSSYGEGKRISELLCAIHAESCPGLEVSIARCFAFVGPHLPLDKHFAIGNFINAAIRGDPIIIKGDGTPLRSYLYAADLAYWLWVILFDGLSGKAYNVGGNEVTSISDLAQRVKRLVKSTGDIEITKKPDLKSTPNAYLPSIEQAFSQLGLAPSFGLDEAIVRTIRWATNQTGY